MDQRNTQLLAVIHQPRIAMAFIAAGALVVQSWLEGASLARAALIVALVVYPFAFAYLINAARAFALFGQSHHLFLIPDWIAIGLCIWATGYVPTLSLAFGLAGFLPAIVVGGLPTGLTCLLVIAAVAVPPWALEAPGFTAINPNLEILGWVALVACTFVVVHAVFEEQRGIIQRARHARRNAANADGVIRKLRRFVAPPLYAAIQDNAHSDDVVAVRRELTVFFSDIAGFTELTDRLPEDTLTRLLNEYLDAMTAVTHKHGGTIDKFIGDGIMIFFDDTRGRGPAGEALGCVAMALEMREEMTLLREVWRVEGVGADLHVRMGIHTGVCRIGNFGSASRMDYTVIGGAVNLASRLENAARPDEILISEQTKNLVSHKVETKSHGALILKGIREPVNVYGVAKLKRPTSGSIRRHASGISISLCTPEVDTERAMGILREAQGLVQAVEADRLSSPSADENRHPPPQPAINAGDLRLTSSRTDLPPQKPHPDAPHASTRPGQATLPSAAGDQISDNPPPTPAELPVQGGQLQLLLSKTQHPRS